MIPSLMYMNIDILVLLPALYKKCSNLFLDIFLQNMRLLNSF